MSFFKFDNSPVMLTLAVKQPAHALAVSVYQHMHHLFCLAERSIHLCLRLISKLNLDCSAIFLALLLFSLQTVSRVIVLKSNSHPSTLVLLFVSRHRIQYLGTGGGN